MRLKNIIIAISATMLVFTACVEESIITPPSGTDGIPTTLSIRFAPETTITKAATDLGYTYAEVDEIVVNSIALAIFDNQTKAVVSCKYATFIEWSGQLSDKKPYYEITGIPAQTGNVNFLAIANSTIITNQAELEEAAKNGQDAFEASCIEDNKVPEFDATKLVKFGKLNVSDLSPTNKSITIALTQLAARVDVGITVNNAGYNTNWNFFITGFSITNGINSKSKVFLPEYNTSYTYNSEIALGGINGKGDLEQKVVKFNFYTYERATSSSNPVKIAIDGYLVDKTDAEVKEAKSYELLLNPTTPASLTNGLVHGYFYDVTGTITPTTMKIEFETMVKSWSEVPIPIGAEIKDIHYLIVKETKIYMSNIKDYFDEYISDTDIEIVLTKATTTAYKEVDKQIVMSSVDCTDDQKPKFTKEVVNGLTKIKIVSPIPTNHFPKEFEFTVTNKNGLTEIVTVTQYPKFYLSSEVSKGGGPLLSGDTGGTSDDGAKRNPNIFTVTVIDSSDLPRGVKVGVSTGPDGQTLQTEELNNLISPKFMVASRYAVVTTTYYTSEMAIARCKTYWETTDKDKTGINATYPIGSWRMPTMAELKFMDFLQDTSGSLINYLFNTNGQYWSARLGYYYDFQPNSEVFGGYNKTISGGGARCVRDIY